ncbi:MAG: DUF2007 domain-containing protein [Actinomycetota bacterium]|nr:DUF2007 domain-containing protein [Actinomycetota bacterium]
MPLVREGAREQEPVTDAHEKARKVRPQFARGELVKVTGGRNQADSELIQNILLEQGIPSILRRTRGFDVPDMLAAGPRDVMVPESGYTEARQLLSDAEMLNPEPEPGSMPGIGSPARLALWILGALAVAFLIVALLDLAVG